MMNNNSVEDELNAIRIGLYEQTKDMTRKERVAYENNKVEQIIKTYDIQSANADIIQTLQ